ncbi:MAG: AAA family ATPase [Methylococcales bacterium]|nr:AAA family ATPase [Methylococcales bacterium]
MIFSKVLLKGVKGVGTIGLDLIPEKKVYTFIAENGVGKTKLLESLFQIFLGSHELLTTITNERYLSELFVLTTAQVDDIRFIFPKSSFSYKCLFNNIKQHNLPIVYMASQNRGFIKHQQQATKAIGNFSDRRKRYIDSLFQGMQQNFSNLNMENDIEQWFITRAQSSNSYQKQADNRVAELQIVLKLLHQLDTRIDENFLEISGDNRVFIDINGNKRQLSQLSTGFASILKIIQSIVAGYGNFTNEQNLQQVKGIVLIDEIESHFHLSWQAKIIPLLKKLFPNTTFYITTHSSIVLTQLEEGEAYKLNRENDGVVRSSPIIAPNKAALIDVLKDAFDIDLNKMKRDNMSAKQQQEAKKKLLDFLIQEET